MPRTLTFIEGMLLYVAAFLLEYLERLDNCFAIEECFLWHLTTFLYWEAYILANQETNKVFDVLLN